MSSPRHSPEKGENEDLKKQSTRTPSPSRRGGVGSRRFSSPPPPYASFKGKPTLAQEIYDEFLVCKICLEPYKNPKSLECLHTFCEQCIDTHIQSESTYKKYSDYREFTCPLCRKRTQLPLGGVKKLQDNFLVSSLSEMVGRRRITKFPFCDICKMIEQKYREGTAKCLDCAKMLCQSCVAAHQEMKVTSGHSIFDIEIEKHIGCTEHPDEMVRFYCEPCEVCICILCTFKEHRQHRVTQFAEAVTRYKASMETMVDGCLEKMDRFDKHIHSLGRCEEILQTVRKKIKETSSSFLREIERREQQLLAELDTIYGAECLEYMEKRPDMSNQVENIRSTCKLAKTILGGKDIELLLVRKDVQEKLSSLNDVELKHLPTTVNKVVEFVNGSVDFGYIYDHDRPLLSTMTLQKKAITEKTNAEGAGRGGGGLGGGTILQLGTSKNTLLVPSGTARITGKNVQLVKPVGAKPLTPDESDASSTESEASTDSSESSSGSSSSGEGVAPAVRDETKNVKRVAMVERSTMTDRVILMDKAINTKARSMLNQSSGAGGGKAGAGVGGGGSGGGGGGGAGSGGIGRRPTGDESSAKDRKQKKREKVVTGQQQQPATTTEVKSSQ